MGRMGSAASLPPSNPEIMLTGIVKGMGSSFIQDSNDLGEELPSPLSPAPSAVGVQSACLGS